MFFVRKRSGSNIFCLCESEAAATCFFCAKAQRQQQHESRQDVGHFGNAIGRSVLRLSSSTLANVWTFAKRS